MNYLIQIKYVTSLRALHKPMMPIYAPRGPKTLIFNSKLPKKPTPTTVEHIVHTNLHNLSNIDVFPPIPKYLFIHLTVTLTRNYKALGI